MFDLDSLRGAEASSDTRDRIIDAGLRVVTRYGVAKTTVDDIAVEAGCARATIYRHFDSREALALAALRREAGRALDDLDRKLAAADSLEDLVVTLYTEAAVVYGSHPVLQAELERGPDVVIATLAGADSPVPEVATDLLVPYIKRLSTEHSLAEVAPRRFADWIVRVGLMYLLSPPPHVDFGDPASTRAFVTTHIFANRDQETK